MIIDRFGIHFGSIFTIHFYGLIIMTGVVAAAFIARRQAKKAGEDPEVVWDVLAWVVIAGIIGARLWHILTPPPNFIEQGITTKYYLTHPLAAIAIWNGGLGILGAVVGGAIALFFFMRQRGLSFARWVDIIAPGLALAQAIGRWGNFVNEELYGSPTNLPWGLYIDPQYRLPQYQNVAYYHPLFLYESLWNLGNMALLLWVSKRYRDRLLPGDVFLIYAIVYPVGRFLLEFLRLDASMVAGININQWIMAGIALISLFALILRHRFTSRPQPVEPVDPTDTFVNVGE